VSAQHVLREALALLTRDHHRPERGGQFAIAVDQHGQRVRPLSPDAVAWTVAGAIEKVDPAKSATDESVYADHTYVGWQAWELLCDAAEAMGLPEGKVVEADYAGAAVVRQLFMRALNVEPERRRVRAGARTGAQPRGAA
jgi:hypothetical protein